MPFSFYDMTVAFGYITVPAYVSRMHPHWRPAKYYTLTHVLTSVVALCITMLHLISSYYILIRINCIDTYQSKSPNGQRLPVIRVYGPLDTDPSDQAVVHIHNVLPFFYVLIPHLQSSNPQKFAAQLEQSLEISLSQAFNRPSKTKGFIRNVQPCRAIDFYGYQPEWSAFVKITLFNPIHTYKCADLLRSGSVYQGIPLQTYESHIPFLLAFMADYDLYGCDWLSFKNAKEKTAEKRLVYSGREFELNARDIVMPSTKADAHVSISSLSEARNSDSQWRRLHDVPRWDGSKLQPQFQLPAFNWPWERASENRQKLRERIKEPINLLPETAKIDKNIVLALPTITQLRSGGDYVRVDVDSKRSSDSDLDTTSISSKKNQKLSNTNAMDSNSSPTDNSLTGQTQHNLALFSNKVWQFATASPSTKDVAGTNGIFHQKLEPYFSNMLDVPNIPFVYGQSVFQLKSHNPIDLEPFQINENPAFFRLFDPVTVLLKQLEIQKRRHRTNPVVAKRLKVDYGAEEKRLVPPPLLLEKDRQSVQLEYAVNSPSTSIVQEWFTEEQEKVKKNHSQSTNASGIGSYQFGSLGNREIVDEEMSICVIEIHVQTRPGKVPKASEDPIAAVFWQFSSAAATSDSTLKAGVITNNPLVTGPSVQCVDSEMGIIEEVIKMTRFFNPDILTGFEIMCASWGYIEARYQVLTTNLEETYPQTFFELIGRVAVEPSAWKAPNSNEAPTVLGRNVLNLWNIMRHEASLSKYTLEYVVYHCLHERTPHYSYDTLRTWWLSEEPSSLNALVSYYSRRTYLVQKLFEHFELINRTCEKSRIIGIDFVSSLTRGSQFQVEAVMCRLARKQNYALISPSKEQVGQQNALEYIPLVMEPRSEYYTDPVCVLDFRSLYPSIVIAFNLCYSTCLGNVSLWRNHNKIGVKQDHVLPPAVWKDIGEENIYVAPNGMAYVTPKVRQSLLALMLGEILDTRFMINSTRKYAKESKSDALRENGPRSSVNRRLERNLNGKQLALKFIANVTYGYTSASFSGRMPLAELADSIVLAGREILENTIRTLESPNNKWGVQPQVVYGDTDSLFVKLPGVSRESAFKIGQEMADMITSSTPDPILLKLEKVYHPCILLTKKRYVGNSFESPGQTSPCFDAKGIETVRRDGTPVVQIIEKGALKTLFASSDLSMVKRYLQVEWRRILRNEYRAQDFCFAQEVKLGHYKSSNSEATLPGGAVISLRRMQQDDGFEPQYRERIPFLITAGPRGSRINDRIVSPEEYMRSPHLTIDFEHYILKAIIPPLERLFNLMGANVRDWYVHMPRTIRLAPVATAVPSSAVSSGSNGTRTNLRTYLESDTCQCCLDNRRSMPSVFCQACSEKQPRARYILISRHRENQNRQAAAQTTCNLCALTPRVLIGRNSSHPCQSIDCSVYYDRVAAEHAVTDSERLLELF